MVSRKSFTIPFPHIPGPSPFQFLKYDQILTEATDRIEGAGPQLGTNLLQHRRRESPLHGRAPRQSVHIRQAEHQVQTSPISRRWIANPLHQSRPRQLRRNTPPNLRRAIHGHRRQRIESTTHPLLQATHQLDLRHRSPGRIVILDEIPRRLQPSAQPTPRTSDRPSKVHQSQRRRRRHRSLIRRHDFHGLPGCVLAPRRTLERQQRRGCR